MKTFEEFVQEGVAAHYAAHYAKKALRSAVPRIQRYSSNKHSEGYR